MSIALQHPYDVNPRGARRIIGASTGAGYSVDGLGRVIVADADAPYLQALGWLPINLGSGANVVLLDFGAFPGSLVATTTVAGGTRDSTALVDAYIVPLATVDHSADEHVVDGPIVSAQADGNGNLIISAYPNTNVFPIDRMMPWGKWSVVWNYLE